MQWQGGLAYRYFYAAATILSNKRFRFGPAGIRFFQLLLMEQIRFIIIITRTDGTGFDAGATFDAECRVRMAVRCNGAEGTDADADAAIGAGVADLWEDLRNGLMGTVGFLRHHVRSIGHAALDRYGCAVSVIGNRAGNDLGKTAGLIEVLAVGTALAEDAGEGVLANECAAGNGVDMGRFHDVPELNEGIVVVAVAVYDDGNAHGAVSFSLGQIFQHEVRDAAGIDGHAEDDQGSFGKAERFRSFARQGKAAAFVGNTQGAAQLLGNRFADCFRRVRRAEIGSNDTCACCHNKTPFTVLRWIMAVGITPLSTP